MDLERSADKLNTVNDYLFEVERAIARALEKQREFNRLLDQAADPLRQIREAMDLKRDWATHFQLAQTGLLDRGRLPQFEALESSFKNDLRNLASRLDGEFAGAKLQIESFKALRLDLTLAPVLRLKEELAELSAAAKVSYESFVTPERQVQAALASLEASARLTFAPGAHWSNALAVVASYEQFAIRQTKKLVSDSKVVGQRRARVTELAGSLLVASLGASDAAGSEPQSESPRIVAVEPRLFGPLNSHLGFVYRASVEVDIELAVAHSLPARICHLGGAIVSIAVQINEIFRRAGSDDVFRPTNRSLQAASIIPAVVAQSEQAFANVIDALFFLLYEGSGAGGTKNARLSPLLSDDDLLPLWRIKHLRHHYRHDVEHGDFKEVPKKQQRIGAVFMTIVGKRAPNRSGDWTSAQAELYKQLYEMLTKAEEAAQAAVPTT